MIFIRYAKLIKHKFGVAFGIPAIQIGKFRLKLACADTVLLGKIGLCVKRVLFLHNFYKAGIAHKHRAHNFIFIIFKVILLQNGKPFARSDDNLALLRLKIAA